MATAPTPNAQQLNPLTVAPARSRAEQLADTLAEHIASGGFAPGDRYGTLDEIRAQVGLARTTVSEAVRLLRERGVLEIRPGRGGGLFVAERTPLVRMRHTLLKVRGSTASVRDAVELREALEAPIALGTSLSCGEADAERLRAAARDMVETGIGYDEFLRRNWYLHELIAELNPNRMMGAVYTSCLGYLGSAAPSYGSGKGDDVESYITTRGAAHLELVEAILSGDADRILAAVRAHNLGAEEDRL